MHILKYFNLNMKSPNKSDSSKAYYKYDKFRKVPFIRLSRLYAAFCLLVLLACFYYYIRQHSETNNSESVIMHERENLEVYLANEQRLGDSNEAANFIEPVEPQVAINERIVHLDFKGAPPKISYFEKLFPLLKEFGATGILIEYEDMFPYSGDILGNSSALNSYDLDDIHTLNTLAKETNLKLIPLIQTFGHLEFLLKLEDFKHYREVEQYPQVICPSRADTLKLIENMIDQIVKAHPDSDMLHIGCDEVYYLGYCPRCTARMATENISKNHLFLQHLNSVAEIIKRKYPKLRVLMWDDMFRNMPDKELMKIKFTDNLTPVVWRYTQNVFDELGPSLWTIYSKVFPSLWVASAFKGATGSNAYTPNSHHYVLNHKSWFSLIAEHKHDINFQGIILTGWQRYDHFAVLCELLPVGMPALGMSLRLLRGFQDSPLNPPTEVARILKCSQPFGLIGTAFGTPRCKFPGGDILENILLLHQLTEEFDRFKEDPRVKGWMSDYNINHDFSNPQHIESVTLNLGKIKGELEEVRIDLISAMEEVYDQHTIDEWIETYLEPFEKKVNKMWNARENLLAIESWPRRPLKREHGSRIEL